VRRSVEGRRRSEAAEGVLKEAMRILQVDSWDELVHNLRARVERFRSLDECTFKILELEAINKRVVNDFEERLQVIREDQEEGWERERQLAGEELKGLQRGKDNCERENEALRAQIQSVLADISRLASDETNPSLHSGHNELHELKRLMVSLRSRLQEIEVEAEENMFKLLKSNEEMVRLERSIGQLRGEMELQIEELEDKNEQNICEISHLQAQLEQQDEEIA
jgi:chromosome segregation ATPase